MTFFRYYSKTNMDLLNRVPEAFLLLAGVYLGFQILGCLLMFENDTKSNNNNNNSDKTINDNEDKEIRVPLNSQPKEIKNSLGVWYKI
jgi:hypothetical protein